METQPIAITHWDGVHVWIDELLARDFDGEIEVRFRDPNGQEVGSRVTLPALPVSLPCPAIEFFLEWRLAGSDEWHLVPGARIADSLTVYLKLRDGMEIPFDPGGTVTGLQTGAICDWRITAGTEGTLAVQPIDPCPDHALRRAGPLVIYHRGRPAMESREAPEAPYRLLDSPVTEPLRLTTVKRTRPIAAVYIRKGSQ